MAPKHEPEVTDLERYRKAKAKAEAEKRKPPPRPKAPGQSFLGSNPRAGLILAIVAILAAILWLGPLLWSLVARL
jgi:hypothetical protein